MPEDYHRPKALIYWRNEAGFSKYLAIYVDSAELLGNCIPLHSQVMPVDEENMERLKMEMKRIGADLLDAGSINPHSTPEKIPGAIYDYLRRKSSGEYVRNDIVSADDLAYSLWTEEECLRYFTGLVGRLRDVSDDPLTRDNIAAEMRRMGKASLLKRYESDINRIVLAAASRSKEGHDTANLYLQKLFAIHNERYEDAQKLQDRINEAKSGT